MVGLVIKDILNLKKGLRTSLLIFFLFSLIAYKSQDPGYLVGIFVFIMSTQSISSMSYDELAKWDIYALTMPISRRKLVISKYILSVLLSIIGLVLSIVVGYFWILPASSMGTLEFLIGSYLIFCASIVFISILFPLIYKFGVEKTRLLVFIVISVPILIGILVNEIGIVLPRQYQLISLLKISPFIIIIALFISGFISCRIYKNKDM